MANGVFNIARGKIAYYGGLPAANDGIVIVVLEATEADDTLNNYDDLSTLLAAAGNTEATATNYARKVLTSGITVTVDDTGNDVQVIVDSDQTWTSVTGNAFTDLLVCYDPDTTTGNDTTIIPLTYHDFVVTPNGGDITANFDQTAGFWGST